MRQVVWSATAAFVVALFVGVPIAAAEDVYLTPEERSRVVALVRADPRIRAALDGRDARVEDVLPWSADCTRETLIGGGVTLAFVDSADCRSRLAVARLSERPRRVHDHDDALPGGGRGREWTRGSTYVRTRSSRSTISAAMSIWSRSARSRPARAGASAAGDRDDGGPSRSALVAGLVLGSLLVSGIALGHRYGPARE